MTIRNLLSLLLALAAVSISASETDRVTLPSGAGLYVHTADNPNGMAVLICPGGGYVYRAMDHEGHAFAEWLNGLGVTCGVLEYGFPGGDPAIPVSDAADALEVLRGMGHGPVGIMGFSAGGHLASTVATHLDSLSAPDFQILFYPVVTMDSSFTHRGSRDQMIGSSPSDETVLLYSNERQVGPSTPPAIIFHCSDDVTVPVRNAVDYYTALNRNNVPASLVVFPSGGHGWGFNDTFRYKASWQQILSDWLRSLTR